MSYGNIIKKIRKSKNLSLRAFQKLVNVDYSYLARLEKEQSNKGKERLNPTIDILKQICDCTGYSFRQFLEEAGYIKPPEPLPLSPIQQMYDQMTAPQQQMLMKLANALLDNSDTLDYAALFNQVFTGARN